MAAASTDKRIGDYKVKKKEELGRGTYGKVYLGTHVRTGKYVAAKKITDPKVKVPREVNREAEIMKRVPDHENLIRLLDYMIFENPSLVIWLIVEYCPLGNLDDFAKKKRLSVMDKVDLAAQCARGVHHLHSQVPSIIHRDLKPQNILVAGTMDKPVAKVADLGEAKIMEIVRGQTMSLNSEHGTRLYMAPEVFPPPSYNKKADVFSLGATILAVVNAVTGVKDTRVQCGAVKVFLGKYLQQGYSYDINTPGDSGEVLEVKSILFAMLKRSPSDRPSIQVALQQFEHLLITLRARHVQPPATPYRK